MFSSCEEVILLNSNNPVNPDSDNPEFFSSLALPKPVPKSPKGDLKH
jgi:hypothetical protein